MVLNPPDDTVITRHPLAMGDAGPAKAVDTRPVTVAAFRRFVKATGYVTWAEVAPDPASGSAAWSPPTVRRT